MVFQWYLFVLLIAVALFASAAQQTYTVEVCGRKEKRYGWVPALMVLIPLIYLAGTRSSAIGDTSAYMGIFQNTPASLLELENAITEDTKDAGFIVFTALLKSIIGNNTRLYLGIIATVCLVPVVIVYKKYSCNFLMSMFLFIASSDYIQWTYNGIRQFIAVAVIFAATDLLLKKKYLPYFSIVLLMSTIHATALLMIPVSLIVQGKPWNLKTVLFTAVVLFAINFAGPLTDLIVNFMSDTQYSGKVGQFLETEGTNILRVLVFCIPPVLALVFKRFLAAANTPILDLSANMSIVSMGAYIVSAVTSGIFVGRIPIYFSLYNYILLPWLVENVFDKRSQRLVYGALILCYLGFYLYQVNTVWGL